MPMQKRFLIALAISTILLTGCRRGGNRPTSTPSEEVPTSATTATSSTSSTSSNTSSSTSISPEDEFCVVTYHSNTENVDFVTYETRKDENYTLRPYMFTAPSGKEFSKWVIGSKEYAPGDSLIVNDDIDVYAMYKTSGSTTKEYLVTFDPNGGSGSMNPEYIEDGFDYVLPKCGFTAPLGFEFVCWGINDDTQGLKPGKTVKIIEDSVIHAYWQKNGKKVYTISFSANGGSGSMSPVQAEEGTYTLPACKFRRSYRS